MTLRLRTRIAAATAVVVSASFAFLTAASPAAADPAGQVIVKSTSNPSFGDSLEMPASCPAGTAVAGGGGYLTAPGAPLGHVALYRLQPTFENKYWVRTQRIDDSDQSWLHTAVAICVPKPTGWEIVSQLGGIQQEYVTTPTCGTGRSVIGAGGRINQGDPNVVLEDVIPSADLKTVTVRGVEITGSNDDDWRVTAYAVCANTPAGLQRVSFSTLSNSDSHKTASVSCPAGKALYGTGVGVNAGNGNVLLSGINTIGNDQVAAWADEIIGGYTSNWSITTYGICGS
jgi:hypothetical protein